MNKLQLYHHFIEVSKYFESSEDINSVGRSNSIFHFSHFTHCRVTDYQNGHFDGDELTMAQIVCRHSDRNMMNPYPNDPWQELSYWPGGLRSLTNIGIQQHYDLGRYFRHRYSKLIGNGEYSADKIYILSTDTDRTIMSAEANLAGFFPPSGNQIWNKNLLWQPIPVHVIPEDDDYLLLGTKKCDRFEYEQTMFLDEDDRFDKLLDENRYLIDYLKENSGHERFLMGNTLSLYDNFYIEKLRGYQIPPWAEKIMIPGGDFERLVLDWYTINTSNDAMKRLRVGYLLKELFERFKHKSETEDSSVRPLWMYFAHEKTIVNILNSVGIFQPYIPQYASCVLFELYQRDDKDYVKIFYENNNDVQLQRIPNCGWSCPVPKMFELYNHILPTKSFDEDCTLEEDEIMPDDGNPVFRKL